MESRKEVAYDASSTSGIYVIKVNTVSLDNIWVYDTYCGSYIWIDMQGLRNSRKLTKGESNFRSIWTNKKPYHSHMKVWGYPAYKTS